MFKDALQDVATIYSINYVTNNSGQQKKQKTALYTNIPVRLNVSSGRYQIEPTIGENEGFKQKRYMQAQPEHGDAVRGNIAVVQGIEYIIVEVQKMKGRNSSIKLVSYIIEENK